MCLNLSDLQYHKKMNPKQLLMIKKKNYIKVCLNLFKPSKNEVE